MLRRSPLAVRLYDYLLLPDDGMDKDFVDRFNENSLEVLDALLEPTYCRAISRETSFQLMRMGYFCCGCKGILARNILSSTKSSA